MCNSMITFNIYIIYLVNNSDIAARTSLVMIYFVTKSFILHRIYYNYYLFYTYSYYFDI